MRDLTAALLVVGPWACVDDPPACYEGDFVSCRCDAGGEGYAECQGEAYGACVCDGSTPGLMTGSGGQGGGGGSGGAERLAYMSPCDEDEQCETGLCFPFNAKGPHCTQTCSGPDDCPPPSTGCNNMGVCKAP